MRIGLITHTFAPEFMGGRENHVKAMAEHLSKKHDVSVFTGSRTKKVTLEDRGDYKVYKIPLISLRLPDKEIYRIIPKFFETLKKENLDLIHAHEYGHFSTDAATIFSIKRNIPLVLSIHGHYFRHPFLRVMKKVYDNTFGYKVIKASKKIICVSGLQKEEIIKSFNYLNIEKKIIIIESAIDVRQTENIKNSEKIVLGLGRLVFRKGFHTLIEASKYIDGAKIVIAGPDGGEKNKLELLIRENSLGQKVKLINAVFGKSKDELIGKCSVYAMPSLYEGVPITLLEAMMHGKPVVCTNLSGLRNVISDGINGLLVEPENPKMLGEKINLLLENKNLSEEIGRRNKFDVLKYDWKEVIKKIDDIYQEVTS